MPLLLKIQEWLNYLSSHPLSFVAATCFISGWITAYFTSHGSFDPGLGVGNLIINGLGLVLMFAACSLAARRDESLHHKIDKIHKHHGIK